MVRGGYYAARILRCVVCVWLPHTHTPTRKVGERKSLAEAFCVILMVDHRRSLRLPARVAAGPCVRANYAVNPTPPLTGLMAAQRNRRTGRGAY